MYSLKTGMSRIRAAVFTLCCFVANASLSADILSAQSLLEAGKNKQALSAIQQSLKADPNDTAALFLKAKILSASNQNKAAISTYQDLIRIQPNRIEAYNNLASLYALNGDLKQASLTLENAIHSDPVFSTVFNNLQAIYSNMSKKHYRAALKLKPNKNPIQLAAINTSQSSDIILSGVSQKAANNKNNIQASLDAARLTKASMPQDTPQVASQTKMAKAVKDKPAKKPKPKSQANVSAVAAQAKKPAKSNAAQVKKALLTWANAWSKRDSKTYIKQYLNTYNTPGNSHKKWAAGRRWNFKSREFIRVNLSNIIIESKGDAFTAKFRQSYESNTFKDTINKILTFRLNSNGAWKISKETIILTG